jgi:hypothetical protein
VLRLLHSGTSGEISPVSGAVKVIIVGLGGKSALFPGLSRSLLWHEDVPGREECCSRWVYRESAWTAALEVVAASGSVGGVHGRLPSSVVRSCCSCIV